jgi:hypothetical protein
VVCLLGKACYCCGTMPAPDQCESLAIKVLYEKSDLYSASLLNAMRHPLFWIAPFAIGSIVYQSLSTHEYGWIIALAVGLVSFSLIPYSAARASVKMPGVLAPITYILSVDGVTAQFENGRNTAAWSLVKGASETGKYIFIQMQRGTFHLMPKRQMTNDQVMLLRQMLREHVSAKVRLSN